MHQSLGVRRRQTAGRLHADPQDIWDIEWSVAVEALLQGDARDVLHDQVGQAVGLVDGMNGDDVIMADGRRRPRLASEAQPARFAGSQVRGQHLDGDNAIERWIQRAEHDAHAAAADHVRDEIGAEAAEMARLLGGAQEAAQEPLVPVDLGPLREQARQISGDRDDVAKRRLRLRGIHVQRLGARGPGAVFAGNLFDVALTGRALGEVLHQRVVVAAGACKEQVAQARPVRASPARHGQIVHVALTAGSKRGQDSSVAPWVLKFLDQLTGPVPFSNRPSLFFEQVNLFPQPLQHAALGHVHGAHGHVQGLGGLLERPGFDRGLPERLPGRLLDFGAHLPGGADKKPLLVFEVPLAIGFLVAGRLGGQESVGARGRRMALAFDQEITLHVANNGKQPTPERPAARIVAEAVHRAGDGAQHILRHIGGVRVLQPAPARVPIDQGTVNVHKLPPGGAVPSIAHADEQAGPSDRHLAHHFPFLSASTGVGPGSNTHERRRVSARAHQVSKEHVLGALTQPAHKLRMLFVLFLASLQEFRTRAPLRSHYSLGSSSGTKLFLPSSARPMLHEFAEKDELLRPS